MSETPPHLHVDSDPEFCAFPHPPSLQSFLNWKLGKFATKLGLIQTSKSFLTTPHASVKRKQSRTNQESPRAETPATPPPVTGSARSLYTTFPVKRHSTRRTTTFDRHIRKDLILRRTAVLPGMTHDLAILCQGMLSRHPTQDWPTPVYGYTDNGRLLEHNWKTADFEVYSEDTITSAFVFPQRAVADLFSTAVSADGVWPRVPGSDHSLFLWRKETDPDQTKALPDACLYVNPTYLDAQSSNVRPEMAKALLEVISQDFSPLAAWEFKDIACATLPVLIAIREICQSPKVFQWVSCSEWGTKGTKCPSRGCVDAHTGKWKVSGRCARFDSPILEEFISRLAERKDVKCTIFSDAARPLKADYRTALCIIQQLWAELVTIEGTVGVINGGNYEMIALRHRATQSLLLSDIHYVPGGRADPDNAVSGPRGPHHMRLHTGLISLITVDGAQRAQLAKTAQGMDHTSFPTRMLNPSEFNITPWRGGYHVDTKTNVRNGASKPLPSLRWLRSSEDFRRQVMTSQNVALRFCGNTVSLYLYLSLPEDGVLNLRNFDQAGVDSTVAVSDVSALNIAIVVLPKNNKGVDRSLLVCNLGANLENDAHYRPTFLGLVARNNVDVGSLVNQLRVHEQLERLGAIAIQRHLGLFLTRDHDFGVLFLEPVDTNIYHPLSDDAVQHTGVEQIVIDQIEAFFAQRSFVHRSLDASNIYVRRSDADGVPDHVPLFFVTDWRLGKVWEGEALDEDGEKELEKDQQRLKAILDTVRTHNPDL